MWGLSDVRSCGFVVSAWCVVGWCRIVVVVGLVMSGVKEGVGGFSVGKAGEMLGWE